MSFTTKDLADFREPVSEEYSRVVKYLNDAILHLNSKGYRKVETEKRIELASRLVQEFQSRGFNCRIYELSYANHPILEISW